MKRICIFLSLCILSFTQAQTKLDSMLVNISLTPVTSGIIYERVTPFANLYHLNENSNQAVDYVYFRQALSELYRASNQTRLISLSTLEQQIAGTSANNTTDVAILNSALQCINYNTDSPYRGGYC